MAKEEDTHEYNNENWDYETRCRRCDYFTFWHFSERKEIDWMRFSSYMTDCMQSPRVYWCKNCKRDTVQDIVSYTQPFEKKI